MLIKCWKHVKRPLANEGLQKEASTNKLFDGNEELIIASCYSHDASFSIQSAAKLSLNVKIILIQCITSCLQTLQRMSAL